MKTLLLSLSLIAFAFAVHAGDVKDAKTKTTAATSRTAAKMECSADKKDDCCSSCSKAESKKPVQALLSPKDAANKRA